MSGIGQNKPNFGVDDCEGPPAAQGEEENLAPSFGSAGAGLKAGTTSNEEEGIKEAAVEPPPEAAGAVPPQGAGARSQAGQPIPPGSVPELPEKFEDFLKIFSRAFRPPVSQRGTASEGDKVLLHSLAWAAWERLHVYEWQVRREEAGLRRALDDLGTQAVESYKDLRVRLRVIELAFKTEPTLGQVMARLEAEIEFSVNQFVKWRYGSDLDQEVFPPSLRMTTTVTSEPRLVPAVAGHSLWRVTLYCSLRWLALATRRSSLFLWDGAKAAPHFRHSPFPTHYSPVS